MGTAETRHACARMHTHMHAHAHATCTCTCTGTCTCTRMPYTCRRQLSEAAARGEPPQCLLFRQQREYLEREP
eukprot:scaffold4216_cov43-Phaeocystis_antarctica.AAC.3